MVFVAQTDQVPPSELELSRQAETWLVCVETTFCSDQGHLWKSAGQTQKVVLLPAVATNTATARP